MSLNWTTPLPADGLGSTVLVAQPSPKTSYRINPDQAGTFSVVCIVLIGTGPGSTNYFIAGGQSQPNAQAAAQADFDLGTRP